MKSYWNFPAATGGMINSINNAGLETFRGNAIESLMREVIQNALDAVKDSTNPVVVEFSNFSTNSSIFPNKRELVRAFELCESTWKGFNKKSEDFIKDGLKILEKENINYLRISDFNTKGLEGAREGKLGTPWSSLVKEAGSSNKDESSGGSFGIGKSAPFLNSKLRTLFYSSFDITGYKSHIGVANIMSFKKENNLTTLGNGYFTNTENSLAIPGQLMLDPDFNRIETGTDIFIPAFEPSTDDWENEAIQSVLFNFFITIFRKQLVVKINEFEINHRNIELLINGLDDNEENRTLKHYFSLLISKKTSIVPYPAKNYKRANISFDEGEAELYLLNGEADELNRRVLMTRKTGMRIFEQKNISGSISFTGILMITGPNMNRIFKQMENPAHNEWSPKRYEKDPKIADKIYAELRKFIRDTVKSKFQEKITDEMDAVGLSDFLPNKNLMLDESENKTESLNKTIKSIIKKDKIQDTKKVSKRKGKETKEIEEQLVGEYGISPTGDEGGNLGNTQSDGGSNAGGTGDTGGNNELDPTMTGLNDKEKQRKPSKQPIAIQQKYICVDKSNGRYRFIIQPKKTIANGRLVFRVLGEQNDYDLPIRQISVSNPKVTIEKLSSNTVHLNSLNKDEQFILNVVIDYPNYCVMEVELYEN
ncbi:hypothetical protein [Ornithinibacillus halophilus]|uniref:Histidine kinase-, DNA gyrase B-, and HSP90-like ATPase n=1 Tax=Ornithinibacillus halophilus TaxID=930117 RepID=A0A1M5KT52_9BACI|nr:hypothetical protein [Ornithinibacillus halophilus]SHG56042.1 hypothetical protein SAMN05216225_104112 [Ornithinibacillus halophilus]